MQIILNEEEAKSYQDQKVREAILAETSKFPDDMKLPYGCKPRPAPLTDEQKSEIRKLHDTGMERGQIARELHLPGRQVSGVVQAYINAKKLSVLPKIEGLQPIQPVVVSESKSPAESPQDEADDIIRQMKGRKYTSIAAEINRATGQIWMADDVSRRIAEMRSDGSQ